MPGLTAFARRRSLKLKLRNIERKIVRLQEEIYQAERPEKLRGYEDIDHADAPLKRRTEQ